MALIIDAPMPKGKCWWEENGVEHECHLFPCWGDADNCPIIGEIPDKHGKLIDADDIISNIERMVHPDDLTHTIAHSILKQIVEDAETIVEATE